MANFLAVVDPDPARRAACRTKAVDQFDALPGLRSGRCGSGAFAAVWATGSRAPVSIADDDQGAGVLWGDAIANDGSRLTAPSVRRAWADVRARPPRAWDAFHAAVTWDRDSGLVAGADLLGLFPVYFWSNGEVVLVASSMAAFTTHASFTPVFNAVGMTGILLTGGLVDGETVWNGVRRLSPGHLLAWSSGLGAREIHQYSIPSAPMARARSFDEHVALLDDALDRAIVRHVGPGQEAGLLLSGGRDSRVIAGMMHRRGMRPQTLTFGEPGDHEAQCAAAVAQTLGLPHTLAPDAQEDVAGLARLHLSQEQLSNGMSSFFTWGMVPRLPSLGDRVLSGYRVDTLIGGSARQLPGPTNAGSDALALHLERTTSYGIAPDVLRRLLRPGVFGGAVDECLERLRTGFSALHGDADHRAWQFYLAHRNRHHPGSTFWRMAFGVWPTALVLDEELTALCASFPLSTLVDRRAEDALLRARFPALARLPLDRNSDVTDPLLPTLGQRLRRATTDHIPFLGDGRRILRRYFGDRRRYYRLYDINSAMWRTVRHMAEDGRRRVGDVLDTGVLSELLPPPDARVALHDPITGSNGLKALLGFLIWWPEHA